MNSLDKLISKLSDKEQLKVINDLSVFFVNEPELKRRRCVFDKLLFKLKIQLENFEDYKENKIEKSEGVPTKVEEGIPTIKIEDIPTEGVHKSKQGTLYSVFAKDRRTAYRLQYPKKTSSAITKLIHKDWNALSETDQLNYCNNM